MELVISLPEKDSRQSIINLKNYIDRASIEGVEGTIIERAVHANGEMGAGEILGSIKAIIQAAEKPLVELVKCLQKFVDNYRTVITIPTKNGNIELKHGRSMTAQQLKELVVAIRKNDTSS
jgi:hypothetical protein